MPSTQPYMTKRGRRYLARWTDGAGKRRTQRGFTSRRAAADFAEEAQAVGRRIRHGLTTAAEQKRLRASARPIADHLREYLDATQTQSSERHISQVRSAIETVIAACAWTSLADVSADGLQKCLAARHRGGSGPATLNHWRTYLRSFTAWCARNGRLASDPLAAFPRYDAAADRRRVRRAFTDDEFTRLVKAAPEDRAMLYWLLVSTGLRIGEARSLTRRSFHLDDPRGPYVVVESPYSKRRRRDEQPIPHSVAARLRPWLEAWHAPPPGRGRPVAAKGLWRIPEDASGWIKRDLAAAKIAYEDPDGRILDMHSLRHTYITRLARSGIPAKEAQALARHSTITLTMDVYAHVEADAARAALERAHGAPGLDANAGERRLTGQTAAESDPTENELIPAENAGEIDNGQGGIRTPEGLSHQIYSLTGQSDPSIVPADGCASSDEPRAADARPENAPALPGRAIDAAFSDADVLRGAERRHPGGLPQADQVIGEVAAKIEALCSPAPLSPAPLSRDGRSA